MDDFWSRIDRFLYEFKFFRRKISETLVINESTVSTWYKNRTLPRADEAVKIAKLLDTTVEFLVTGEYEGGITEEQRELLRDYQKLDERDRMTVKKLIVSMIGTVGREYFEKMKNTPEYEKFIKENPVDQPTGVYEPEPPYIPTTLQREEKSMYAGVVNEPEPVYLVEPLTPVRSEVVDSVIFLDWGVAEIPLLGTTAAGRPIDFGDIPLDPLTRKWSANLIKGDPADYYCVAIRGESMTEADIKDGDHALLKHAQKPKQGEIMLVRHDNSSTLKRIRIVEGKNGQEEVYICWEDGSKRKVKLDDKEYEIQGLLVAIERKPGKR